MLKFLRYMRKSSRDPAAAGKPASASLLNDPSGRTSRYMLYAAGEVLLVMVGILLALQVNNWNESRKAEIKERNLLLQLKKNMVYNLTQIDAATREFQSKCNSIDLVSYHIVNKLPFHDSLKYHFYGPFSPGIIELTSSSYETFKSIGFDLIRSDELRESIINIYEINYPQFEVVMKEVLNNWEQGMIIPYYSEHFSFEQSGLTPNDYSFLLTNQKFQNILSGRRTLFKFILNLLEVLKEKTTGLHAEIDVFLDGAK